MARYSLNYILIPLTHKGEIVYAKIDKEDAAKVLQYGWSMSRGYARAETGENRQTISMHRLVLNTPEGVETDHINRDRLDNRKGNLRVASRASNNQNSVHKKGKNPYRGVYQKSQNSFAAIISTGDKRVHLGSYKTPELAAVAYNRAAEKYHGVFAVLNEVPEVAT